MKPAEYLYGLRKWTVALAGIASLTYLEAAGELSQVAAWGIVGVVTAFVTGSVLKPVTDNVALELKAKRSD